MDEVPEPGTIFADLAKRDQRQPGRARCCSDRPHNGWGVRRLLKALRHEAPGPDAAAARLGVDAPARLRLQGLAWRRGRPAGARPRLRRSRSRKAASFKTRGRRDRPRSARLFAVQGDKTAKIAEAEDGDVVAVAKVEGVKAGEWLASGKLPPPLEIALPVAQLRARHRTSGPQGRRPAVDRAAQADRGGCEPVAGAGRGAATRCASRASTTSISRSRWRGSSGATASRSSHHAPSIGYRGIDPPDRSPSAAATRSSRAAMASLAT